MFDTAWWETSSNLFETIFRRKNRDLWDLIWRKVAARAWAAGYIKAHLAFGLPGEKPSYEDIVELRFPDAKAYFEQHGLEFVKSMTETDKDKLRADLIEGWGMGAKAFARKYKQNYSFSPKRLTAIYRTEVHLSQRTAQNLGAMKGGMRYKTWEATGDEAMCPICGKLNHEKVPINAKYSNGMYVAHGHPRCRCVELYTNE